jgi:epoxyqueuosine reductase
VNPATLSTAEVKAEALRLGFSHVGIATADRFAEAERFLLDWIRQGRHGEMGWIAEERAQRACRPDELLPGARSLIAVAAPYGRGAEPGPPSQHGRVARYARGVDYHELMKGRLRVLAEALRQQGGGEGRYRIFVDDGPLLDREVALRAGLGFIGKNTCLIAPGAGSYLLLGTLLTDLPLVPDQAPTRDCGSCRLCLDACPTGALDAPYQLDARRCISYLTIELRGPIPLDLRPAIGARVFGCDICQEVCPYNHGRGPLPWPELEPRAAVGTDLDLVKLIGLDDEAFRQRFRGTSLRRTKRRGLLRNAAVALANAGNPDTVPALARALAEEPEPLVRAHAAWALRRLGGPEAEAALAAARQRELDPTVRTELDDPR